MSEPRGPTGASGAGPIGSMAAGSTPSGSAIAGTGTSPRAGRASSPRPRAAAGSSYQIMSGARRVKGYPVTRDELFTLGGVGLLTSAFLGFGSNLVSRSFDLAASLDLSPGVAPEMVERWHTREYDFWYIGLILFIARRHECDFRRCKNLEHHPLNGPSR
jgi:hypothetical protein